MVNVCNERSLFCETKNWTYRFDTYYRIWKERLSSTVVLPVSSANSVATV